MQEEIYVEEKKAQVKQMMAIHLETFPVAKGAFENKTGLYKMKKSHNNIISMMDLSDDSEQQLSKSVTGLSFNLQVHSNSVFRKCVALSLVTSVSRLQSFAEGDYTQCTQVGLLKGEKLAKVGPLLVPFLRFWSPFC